MGAVNQYLLLKCQTPGGQDLLVNPHHVSAVLTVSADETILLLQNGQELRINESVEDFLDRLQELFALGS